MSWTQADVAAHMRKMGAVEAPKLGNRAKAKRGMNKWEFQYGQYLFSLKCAGIINWYRFEGFKIRLASGAYYKPDFTVKTVQNQLEFHEVKGIWREAALVRFKVAAEHFPFRFIAVSKAKNGEWETIKELNG